MNTGRPVVLVVDDSPSIREMIEFTLEDAGYTVVQAVDGSDALAQLQRMGGGVACALVDVNMPVMDGIDLIRALRADRRFAFVPAVVLTKDSQITRRAEAMRAGATGYLTKPFVPEELIETIRTVVSVGAEDRRTA